MDYVEGKYTLLHALVPDAGIKPATYCLQGSCSIAELIRRMYYFITVVQCVTKPGLRTFALAITFCACASVHPN